MNPYLESFSHEYLPQSPVVRRVENAPYVHPSILIGKGTIIKPTAVIEENCIIGDNCFIGHNVVMRNGARVGNNTKISHFTLFEENVTVGNDVTINDFCGLAKNMVVEDQVFVGAFVNTANDRYMVHLRRHIQPFVEEPPIYRRACRIGCNCIILPRVEIGENAVVGAGSVVTKNVGPRTVVYGNPARFIMMVPEKMVI